METVLVQVLVAMGIAVIGFAITQIKSKLAADGLTAKETAWYELLNVVGTAVNAGNQTVVSALKAENGGKLSPEAAVKIKEEVIKTTIESLSSSAIKRLNNDYPDLERVVSTLIENQIWKSKN